MTTTRVLTCPDGTLKCALLCRAQPIEVIPGVFLPNLQISYKKGYHIPNKLGYTKYTYNGNLPLSVTGAGNTRYHPSQRMSRWGLKTPYRHYNTQQFSAKYCSGKGRYTTTYGTNYLVNTIKPSLVTSGTRGLYSTFFPRYVAYRTANLALYGKEEPNIYLDRMQLGELQLILPYLTSFSYESYTGDDVTGTAQIRLSGVKATASNLSLVASILKNGYHVTEPTPLFLRKDSVIQSSYPAQLYSGDKPASHFYPSGTYYVSGTRLYSAAVPRLISTKVSGILTTLYGPVMEVNLVDIISTKDIRYNLTDSESIKVGLETQGRITFHGKWDAYGANYVTVMYLAGGALTLNQAGGQGGSVPYLINLNTITAAATAYHEGIHAKYGTPVTYLTNRGPLTFNLMHDSNMCKIITALSERLGINKKLIQDSDIAVLEQQVTPGEIMHISELGKRMREVKGTPNAVPVQDIRLSQYTAQIPFLRSIVGDWYNFREPTDAELAYLWVKSNFPKLLPTLLSESFLELCLIDQL